MRISPSPTISTRARIATRRPASSTSASCRRRMAARRGPSRLRLQVHTSSPACRTNEGYMTSCRPVPSARRPRRQARRRRLGARGGGRSKAEPSIHTSVPNTDHPSLILAPAPAVRHSLAQWRAGELAKAADLPKNDSAQAASGFRERNDLIRRADAASQRPHMHNRTRDDETPARYRHRSATHTGSVVLGDSAHVRVERSRCQHPCRGVGLTSRARHRNGRELL